MTTVTSLTASPATRRAPSAAAVFVGFVAVAVLSLVTDQLLHVLGVYPPWGEPMFDTRLNLLALSYRVLYSIAGGHLTASLAPHAPMRHVIVLGIIGFAAGSAGAIAAIRIGNLGPNWYPIALALSAFPCVWLGGRLQTVWRRER